MPFLQDVIHKLEMGGGLRYVRIGLAVMALLLLIAGYNWRAYRNITTREGMDAAQVARNLAQGHGFSTQFVRPFSIHLVTRHKSGTDKDPALLKDYHPDLANPPVYPVFLAGLMKVLPFHYDLDPSIIQGGKPFTTYQPDFIIAIANQLLFYGVIGLTFLLARRLFDAWVAWVASLTLLFSELLWRFTVSGLSTMLLLLIFMGLVWCLVLLEQEGREPKRSPTMLLVFGALCGLMTGLGALTRYSFAWLIIPVLVFIALCGGTRRVQAALLAMAAFCAVMAPWIARNFSVSGTPFGTAGYAIIEHSIAFPDYNLPRSLEPDLSRSFGFIVNALKSKFLVNSQAVLQSEFPRLGGTWLTAFFLVGLLVPFRNPGIKRLRYFAVSALLLLALVQTLGRTHLWEDSPDINSENLLVLLTPLVLVYGVSLFFLLLEQMVLPVLELRYLVIVVFAAIACLPMSYVFVLRPANPVVWPPYLPPAIQTIAGWMKTDELATSDIPWAVAWYGQRQCVWLTLRANAERKGLVGREDFYAISDLQKPIRMLYLTPVTMDARFISEWANERSWGSFVLQKAVAKEVPHGFPLAVSPAVADYPYLANQIVLTDWERWKKAPY